MVTISITPTIDTRNIREGRVVICRELAAIERKADTLASKFKSLSESFQRSLTGGLPSATARARGLPSGPRSGQDLVREISATVSRNKPTAQVQEVAFPLAATVAKTLAIKLSVDLVESLGSKVLDKAKSETARMPSLSNVREASGTSIKDLQAAQLAADRVAGVPAQTFTTVLAKVALDNLPGVLDDIGKASRNISSFGGVSNNNFSAREKLLEALLGDEALIKNLEPLFEVPQSEIEAARREAAGGSLILADRTIKDAEAFDDRLNGALRSLTKVFDSAIVAVGNSVTLLKAETERLFGPSPDDLREDSGRLAAQVDRLRPGDTSRLDVADLRREAQSAAEKVEALLREIVESLTVLESQPSGPVRGPASGLSTRSVDIRKLSRQRSESLLLRQEFRTILEQLDSVDAITDALSQGQDGYTASLRAGTEEAQRLRTAVSRVGESSLGAGSNVFGAGPVLPFALGGIVGGGLGLPAGGRETLDPALLFPGFSDRSEDLVAAGDDAAGQLEGAFRQAFGEAEAAVRRFVETGAFSLKGFLRGTLQDITHRALDDLFGLLEGGLFGDGRGGGGLFGQIFGGGLSGGRGTPPLVPPSQGDLFGGGAFGGGIFGGFGDLFGPLTDQVTQQTGALEIFGRSVLSAGGGADLLGQASDAASDILATEGVQAVIKQATATATQTLATDLATGQVTALGSAAAFASASLGGSGGKGDVVSSVLGLAAGVAGGIGGFSFGSGSLTGLTPIGTGTASAFGLQQFAPRFAAGGRVFGRPIDASGAIPILAHAGETVMTADATRRFGPVLDLMNAGAPPAGEAPELRRQTAEIVGLRRDLKRRARPRRRMLNVEGGAGFSEAQMLRRQAELARRESARR